MRRPWIGTRLGQISKQKKQLADEAFDGRAATVSDLIAGRPIGVEELPKLAAGLQMPITAILDHEIPGWRGEPLSANHQQLSALTSTYTSDEAGRAFSLLQLALPQPSPPAPRPRRSRAVSKKAGRANLRA